MKMRCVALLTGCFIVSYAAADRFALMKGERIGPLVPGMQEGEVLRLLGAPGSKSASVEEAATGNIVQNWVYKRKGIDIKMAKSEKNGKYSIESLSVKRPCSFTTARGIRIGSTLEEVKKAYPPDTWDREFCSDERIVAGSIYGGLIFHIKNGMVVSLFLGAAAE